MSDESEDRRHRPLPRNAHYIKPSPGSMRYWKLGGPFTDIDEAEAKKQRDAKPPSKMGLLILRMLGFRKKKS